MSKYALNTFLNFFLKLSDFHNFISIYYYIFNILDINEYIILLKLSYKKAPISTEAFFNSTTYYLCTQGTAGEPIHADLAGIFSPFMTSVNGPNTA